MSNYFYYQKPNYKSSDDTKIITVDTDNNKIIIEDTSTGKIINIDTVGVQNQLSQGFSWVQLYECVILQTTWSNNYTLPISFTTKLNNSISYTSAGNWEDVIFHQINFPPEAFDPSQPFNDWAINFSLNCVNMSVTNDKGLAMYFQLEDSITNIYTPYSYNLNTPYVKHLNNSTYSNTSSDLQNYCWSDTINLTGVNSQVPIFLRFAIYMDNNMSCGFDMVVTFTRTNVV
jgi:hypothetical protein